MTAYAGRRLLAALPLLWAALTLVFLLLQAVPGGPFSSSEDPALRPEAIERLRHLAGADRPLLERYGAWLLGLATGDLGMSLAYRRPVADLIRESAWNTLYLAGAAIVAQFLFGAAMGAIAARARGGWADRAITAAAACLYAMPSFWIGLALVWGLAVHLGWFPVSQMRSIDAAGAGRFLDAAHHLVLPCLSLALPAAGGIALYVRDEMRAVLGQGFVRSARARGLGSLRADLRHALPNSLVPLVNLLGMAVPGLLGGSIVIEVLFAWPGMGRLAYQAVLARDQLLVLGCVAATSGLVILGSLLADILTAVLDPRAREPLA